jgi:hypothetical protein
MRGAFLPVGIIIILLQSLAEKNSNSYQFSSIDALRRANYLLCDNTAGNAGITVLAVAFRARLH